MDITRTNFKENLQKILSSISDASFLSIDGEFTGLSSGKGIHAFDTPRERYVKLKEAASNFLLIQFGLCTFHYDKSSKCYTHRAFNFHIFPRPYKRGAPDSRFLCQASSLDFLVSQGFDFNKLFKEGLSYLTPSSEAKLRSEIEEKYENRKIMSNSPSTDAQNHSLNRTPMVIPSEHEEFIRSICAQIDLFLVTEGDESLELPPANRFVRKLIYETCKSKYAASISLETKSSDSRISSIIVTRSSSEENFNKLEDAKLKEELRELDDAVGFVKIIKAISKSKKLVVGHNMLLDLLLSVNQFSCPLPEDYEDFKALINCLFPNVLDTKHMASTDVFKDMFMSTALSDLLRQLSAKSFSQPEIDTSIGFQGYSTENFRLHEAGFDAFITGVSFITMYNYIGSLRKSEVEISSKSEIIKSFINKLFLLRILDIPYMNLSGTELTPNRDHVFHVRFPKEWKTGDLIQLFSCYGKIYIAWIDEDSALVALKQCLEHPSNVIKTLGNNPLCQITTYNEYQKKSKISDFSNESSVVSDVAIKRKRKLSSSGQSLKKMETIAEEENENVEQEPSHKKKRNDSKSNWQYDTLNSTEVESDIMSKPFTKRNTQSDPVKKKIFEESENWET